MKSLLQTSIPWGKIMRAAFCPTLMIFALTNNSYASAKSSITTHVEKAKYEINGKVTDAKGEALPGVSVKIKGTTTATITDVNGNYKLSLANGESVLVFSFIGFETQEIAVNNRETINVKLKDSNNTLDDVVVVAYTTQKRATITGAIEKIDAKVFQDRAITNVGLALQGQTPGLVVTRSSARPGNEGLNFQIRGATSINGGSPLIVIDGVPIVNYLSFQNMNPDDIESISVLKDGSAAIYGSRGANGVILVTTKKGKGKVKIDYSGNMRFTTNGITGYSNSQKEYASLWLQANKEEAIPNWWGWDTQANMEKLASGYEGIYTTRYWGDVFIGDANRIDEMFARRYSYQHNLSISNRSENSGYRLSLGYADNQATLATAYDGQKQYNLRLNYDYKLSNRIKLETGITLINAVTKSPSTGLDSRLFANDMPFFPAKNPYGQWNANFGKVGNRNSVAATTDGGRDNKNSLTGRFDLKATVNLIKDLDFEGLASFQNEQYKQEKYVTPVQLYDWYGNKSTEVLENTVQNAGNPGYTSVADNHFYQYYSGLLRYNKTLNGLHNISAVAGINAEIIKDQSIRASRVVFTNLGVQDLSLADPTTSTNGGGKTQTGLYSYLARINYNYAEKYLVEALGRHDGNARFDKGFKFRDFGSVQLGWVFTKEKFLKNLAPILDFGKIRTSYAVKGNDAGLGNFEYLNLISTGTTVLGSTPGYLPTSFVDNNGIYTNLRTWETVYEKNIGVDLGFLKNRLTTTFDYFIKDNKQMLIKINYPTILGGSAPKTNDGHLNVKGWEATIGWKDHKGDFSYNVSFNISDNRTLLKSMENATSYGAGRNATLVGSPLNSWFLYQTDGYFQSQAEVDAYLAKYTGDAMAKVAKGTAGELRPGDTRRLDINGDGSITANGVKTSDLKFMGDANQHYTFGLNLGGSWKGFDLNAFFQGVGKQMIMRTGNLAYPFATIYTNQPTNYEGKTWTVSNTNAEFPRLTTNQDRAYWNYGNNDFMLQNSRYIRLKSLVIGYTIPQSISKKASLEKLRIYFSGNDLWEATSIKDGFDPEMGEVSQNVGYPFYRTWSMGLNVGL